MIEFKEMVNPSEIEKIDVTTIEGIEKVRNIVKNIKETNARLKNTPFFGNILSTFNVTKIADEILAKAEAKYEEANKKYNKEMEEAIPINEYVRPSLRLNITELNDISNKVDKYINENIKPRLKFAEDKEEYLSSIKSALVDFGAWMILEKNK